MIIRRRCRKNARANSSGGNTPSRHRNSTESGASLSYKVSSTPSEAADTVRPCFRNPHIPHPQNEELINSPDVTRHC